MPPPVFRFAPSPNGYLHLGHAYSALLNFDSARRTGGRFLLRIEDIDAARCKPEFETDRARFLGRGAGLTPVGFMEAFVAVERIEDIVPALRRTTSAVSLFS